MRIYYAHPRGTYDTVQECNDLDTLETMGFVVLNPNQRHHQENCHACADVMDYFLNLVGACDALAFRSFEDGLVGAGCVKEINHAIELGLPIIEMPNLNRERFLTIEQTQAHQPQIYKKA